MHGEIIIGIYFIRSCACSFFFFFFVFFFVQAEDGIRDLVRSRGLGDVYKRQTLEREERLRDLLAQLGLQEIWSYRLTGAGREARLLPGGPPDDRPYVTLSLSLIHL